jgi:rubrerythrin
MAIAYNASEACEIAIDIEKNGKAFYLAAAENTNFAEAHTIFAELAAWEDQHVKVFTQLAEEYQAISDTQPPFDPDNVIGGYLKATADTHIFVQSENVALLAKACTTAAEALLLALTFEKDSVVFYSALRSAVPEALGATTVQKMIDEEISHISYLSDALAKIRKAS